MEIILNGKKHLLEKELSVKELLTSLENEWNIDLKGAVVLVNDDIIKKDNWEKFQIKENAEVEVLSFVSGG
ncbi:sulfur carrier protein ThiS [uncultured Fusobacterium sp.]|jgi:sulfur carrier protein|uniref:sulfur carrier protein ThiS n=1 Tax=uncultured Fusobacterium sp. TaxID=159267 RepID=UPI0025E99F2C|nr:sulfur carrier protein ThiS [uncultured Fusobacterium sp.]MCF2639260.1 sulfur carrier protein ThiS [Fusobacterium varium]